MCSFNSLRVGICRKLYRLSVCGQALQGRTVVPNFNSLSLEQRRALLAASAQQQQQILADPTRQLRPGAIQALAPGLALPTRVALTSNGPTAVLPPALRGIIPRTALAPGTRLPLAALTAGTAAIVQHKAEKRKYDSLRLLDILCFV